MRIAIATCANLPAWEVDDRPLHDALLRRGVKLVTPAWDDENFDWGSCDACLIRTTWDYAEKREEYVAWAERISAGTKLFNSADLVRWNTDKRYLRDLESSGVPVIPTHWIEAGSSIDLGNELTRRGWQKAFLKPVIGASARETLRFDATESGLQTAQTHLDRLLLNESMILQPYLPSVETEGELSAIFVDGKLTHAVRKKPVPGDYRVQDDYGASDELTTLTDAERALANGIMDRVPGDCLYGRVDLLRDNDGRLKLTELELVEPSMFFRHCPSAAERLAAALCSRLK